VNIVTTNFNTNMGQTAETYQWKKKRI